jgi:hypothetical protein
MARDSTVSLWHGASPHPAKNDYARRAPGWMDLLERPCSDVPRGPIRPQPFPRFTDQHSLPHQVAAHASESNRKRLVITCGRHGHPRWRGVGLGCGCAGLRGIFELYRVAGSGAWGATNRSGTAGTRTLLVTIETQRNDVIASEEEHGSALHPFWRSRTALLSRVLQSLCGGALV